MQPSDEMKYIPQIDTLRFLCAFIVIFQHLPILPDGNVISYIFEHITGVDIFFVLSGFLITSILLKTKNDEVNKSILNFYIRRFLRIFPIYYLSIFLLIIVNPSNYRDYAIFDLAYISNFKMGWDGDFTSVTPHFWSLAVEEQFYLFWPFLLLIVFRTRKYFFLISTVVLGIISFFVFLYLEKSFFGARTFNNIAYLGAGGLLSWFFINGNDFYFKGLKKISSLIMVSVFILGIICYFLNLHYSNDVGKLVSLLFSIAAVHYFSCPLDSVILKRIFLFQPAVFLGKISYGLYVYHMLMIIPFTLLIKNFDFMSFFTENEILTNLFKIFLTVLAAICSWYLVEKPLLNLKKRFN